MPVVGVMPLAVIDTTCAPPESLAIKLNFPDDAMKEIAICSTDLVKKYESYDNVLSLTHISTVKSQEERSNE